MSLERYLKHEKLYAALMFAVFLLVNNPINATSILMEADRSGLSIPLSRHTHTTPRQHTGFTGDLPPTQHSLTCLTPWN